MGRGLHEKDSSVMFMCEVVGSADRSWPDAVTFLQGWACSGRGLAFFWLWMWKKNCDFREYTSSVVMRGSVRGLAFILPITSHTFLLFKSSECFDSFWNREDKPLDLVCTGKGGASRNPWHINCTVLFDHNWHCPPTAFCFFFTTVGFTDTHRYRVQVRKEVFVPLREALAP